MELYKKYKEAYPNKSDAEIIESLAWELKDKVETIHRLLNENQALRIHDVVGRSEQCSGCEESTGETKLWCCNHCGKRSEDF